MSIVECSKHAVKVHCAVSFLSVGKVDSEVKVFLRLLRHKNMPMKMNSSGQMAYVTKHAAAHTLYHVVVGTKNELRSWK